jgi:hypothetical protein
MLWSVEDSGAEEVEANRAEHLPLRILILLTEYLDPAVAVG